MVSTHGYVAAEPPLGAADTGGQVVYVLELAKKLAQLGFEVDGRGAAPYAEFIRTEAARWTPIIRAIGAKAD